MPVETDEALAWLYSRQRFGIRPGLARTRRTLAALGHPESNLRFIHVAGTNGKGSVCATMASVLSTSFKVGLFVSPGFDGLRGRFFISGREIDEARFAELIETVKSASEQAVPDDPLTEFEILTVMAICYFAAEQVDIVVWEAGLGGRYDSTNVVSPEVTIITNVSMDHQEVLGDTIRKIAEDKAGIIKPAIPIVTAATGEALDVITRIAKEQSAPLYVYGRAYAATRLHSGIDGQHLAFRGITGDGVYRQPLLGQHQAANTAVALAALELLAKRQPMFRLEPGQMKQGVAQVTWPGRCEIIQMSERLIILDGAHNPAGARALRLTLKELDNFKAKEANWTLVLGVLADKDAQQIIQELLPVAKQVIVTEPQQQRALPAEQLAQLVGRQFAGPLQQAKSVAKALRLAHETDGPICCCGSLYTVFEARKNIQEQFCLSQN